MLHPITARKVAAFAGSTSCRQHIASGTHRVPKFIRHPMVSGEIWSHRILYLMGGGSPLALQFFIVTSGD